jgi:fructokinase
VLQPVADALESMVVAAPETAVVMLDPNCRPAATRDRAGYLARIDRLLARADVVKVSTDDLAFLRPGVDPAAAVVDLVDRGPQAILWTDGASAVHVVTPDGTTSIVPPRIEVVDTVGAGDAFAGGFLAAWIGSGRGRAELESHDELVTAARHAVRVASFTCTRAGAEPPTSAELAAWDAAR